jgi:hypothetical protein
MIWRVKLIFIDDGADEPFDCLNVTCPSDYFKCPSTGKCISLEKVCDNFDDCPAMDRTNGISEDETSDACSMNRLNSFSFSFSFSFKKDFVLNHFANLTTTSSSSLHPTCESPDLFRCKTSHFCINRTFVCE